MLGAPAQLAVLVASGVGALDRPASARPDRGWLPAGGDLAEQATLGQRLPAGLVVIAGVYYRGSRFRATAPSRHIPLICGMRSEPVMELASLG